MLAAAGMIWERLELRLCLQVGVDGSELQSACQRSLGLSVCNNLNWRQRSRLVGVGSCSVVLY